MSDEFKSQMPPTPETEPSATRPALPIWIIITTLVLLYLGMVYFDHHGGWFDTQVYAPYASAEELETYQPQSGAAAALAHGKSVYETTCGVCHGDDGAGKPNLAPPLAGSEWVNAKDFKRLAHIPLAGLNGSVEVKGQNWSLSMPAMGAPLSDADLADVLSYIRGSWGNTAGPVTAADVKAVRAAIGSHPQPISGPDLKTMTP
jgi:mono/diheme cytochrome c family protein